MSQLLVLLIQNFFLNKLKNEQPDLALLDIHIGELSGFEISKEIIGKFPNQK